MNILIGMAHPKHVHMFKNVIWELENRGHKCRILSMKKDITETLLENYGFSFYNIGSNPPSLLSKFINIPQLYSETLKNILKFKPDIFVGQAFPNLAHLSKIFKKPYLIFEDSEPAKILQLFTFPFAKLIITPSCYRDNLKNNQIRFNGYYELSYLHPDYFTPNFDILRKYGLKENEIFTIFRFVSWSAIHDIGHKGFDLLFKRKLVTEAKNYGKVFISSESPLPSDLDQYRVKISPDEIHHFLNFANVLISDSQTMTTEAGVLGTPAIRYNTFVGINDMGNFVELEKKYGLIFNFERQEEVLEKFLELIQTIDVKEKWKAKKEHMLSEKIDVNKFMYEVIENSLCYGAL
jgi:hypothetical protein